MKNWKYIEGAKTENAGITDKEFNSESEMRRWCIEHNYTYTPVGGGYYRLEDDKPGSHRPNIEAHVRQGHETGNKKVGNSKVGNSLGTDIYQHKLDPNQYMVVDRDKQTVTIIVNGHVRDVIKNLNNLSYVLHLYKKVNVMNTKSGNAFDFETRMVVEKKEELKTAEDELRKAEADRNRHKGERYWEEAYITAKKDVERAKENLARAQRNKTGNDTPWEYARRKPRVINEDKTGAEEFFKKLSDDVKEREKKDDADTEKVGNANLETSVEKGKLGLWNWYVHKDGTIVSGGTSSTETNAKEMARKALEKEKAGNKVGNAKEWDVKDSDVIEYIYGDPNATKLQRICEKNLGTYDTSKVQALLVDEKSNKWAVVKRGTSAKMKVGNATPNYRYKDFLITNPEGHEYIVFLKDGRTVGYRGTTSKAQAEDWCDWHDPKTGKSIGNKVGNARYTTREDVISHLDTDLYDICKKVPAGSPSFAYVSELQKKGWDISTISKYTKEIGKIIDQYKVGNIKFASDYYDIKQESNGKFYIYVNGGAKTYGPMNSEAEAKAELQRILSQRNKTGNRVIEKESEMSQELKNLLKKANPEWKDKVSFAFSHGFDIDENDFINAIKKEVGSSKTGNALKYSNYSDAMAMWKQRDWSKTLAEKENGHSSPVREQIAIYKKDDAYYVMERQKAASMGMSNLEVFPIKRIGNSASDDKFAYVMREFDEGKLKTPDGKVVTDPAQAKAIAYSESKKTENGLARARRAMNKGITMWKGNDSAYIKEDGTVSYLENNSFETDKDKFESQESAIKELSKQGYVKK